MDWKDERKRTMRLPVEMPRRCQKRAGRLPVISKDKDLLLVFAATPVKSWRESNTGAYSERENLNIDVKGIDK